MKQNFNAQMLTYDIATNMNNMNDINWFLFLFLVMGQ
jgi:hypothetical protein